MDIPIDAKIALLIDPHAQAWRTDMVKQYFTQDDAMAIMSIPLSSRLPEDGLVWVYMPRGNFMVRSAYKLAVAFDSSNNFGTAPKVQHHRQF